MNGRILFSSCLGLILLSGCSGITLPNPFSGGGGQAEAPAAATDAAEAMQTTSAIRPPAGARTAAELDTSSDAERAAALAPVATPELERTLGQVSVSLGNATEPGFWLRSSLVNERAQGRVVTSLGESLQVDLLPGEGAAQLSLSAFRSLNLPLTGLPQVTVYIR
ncbi:hypothetical protein [Szabonella alba]|uniref:D-galactarate dehydratase n=1 Tax=Szabonella alba TaxID=2804194 RepID=A0A8K0VD74_9RHOB|nr:hypothetical protein [Szabonella alba]MBL4917157.1 hypothetical protein [Szabonella alba]